RGFQVVIDRLAGLIRQFEFDRATSLFLPHCCTVDRITVRSDILDLERHNIAAPKLAIDGKIEHGQVSYSPLDLQSGPHSSNVLRSQRRSSPDRLALVPRRAADW